MSKASAKRSLEAYIQRTNLAEAVALQSVGKKKTKKKRKKVRTSK
jgi:hypothetical protein